MSNDKVPPRDEQGPNPASQPGTEGERDTPQDGPGRLQPAAGPHADRSLINPDLTPGTGSLPSTGQGGDADPGTD